MSRSTSILVLAAIGSFLFGPAPAAADDEGRTLYRRYCLECHGKQGRGDGEKARRLGFRPRDLALGAFKCRSTPSGRPPTREDLTRVIVTGLPGSAMTGVGDALSETEIDALLDYLATLSPALAETPPPAIALPPAPDDLTDLAAEGRHVYQVLKCWSCHGVSGRGDGPAAKALVDDWGDPIRVFNFVVLRRFKCGGEPVDLYRTLHTGMTGSPMPSYTEAFGFPREAASDTRALATAYEAGEVDSYSEWAAGQPDAAQLAEMSSSERSALVERRTWTLVAYLRSLLDRR